MKRIYYLSVLMLMMVSSMVLTASSQDQIAQTIYVFDGDFNGSLVPDVQVIGQDAAGNSFEGITDLNGSVVLYGQPGIWLFTFMKEGYETLDLSFDVNQTGEGAVYLRRADQSLDAAEASQMDQQPLLQPEDQRVLDYST